ncbi:MAG TPA: hypothetical protein VFJ57_06010 [Solirubrobacterales bacterium]|nr:hypothetical protein [Solirubrobacterales bacterium]
MGFPIRPAVLFALACVAVLCAAAAANARAPRAGSPQISISVPAQLDSGAKLAVTGKVKPTPVRGRVVVQFRIENGWRALGSMTVRNGSFQIARRLPAGLQTTRVRALFFAAEHRRATSKAHPVRVREAQPAPQPQPPAPPLPPLGNPLSEAALIATVQRYSSLPNHLSGTPNSTAAEAEITGALAAAGMTTGQQAFTYPGFLPTQVSLTAGATSVPAAAIAPFLYSGTTTDTGVKGPLFYGDNGVFDKSKVKDKIVVASIAYQANARAVNLESGIEAAVEGGALGFVAVTQGVGNYPKWQDSNARTGTGPLPVVMVGKQSGKAVVKAAENGESGTLTLTADTATACDRDVWGELEGADPSRRVFVGVPASSFTPSAAEHGAGVAILLGLARHYAAIPKSQRPVTLVFIAVGGHEIGWLGLQALLASSRASWFEGADAYVHLGSALGALTASEEPNGEIVTSPVPPTSTALYNSENPLLVPAVGEIFAAAGVPTKVNEPFLVSGGEQTTAFAAGIPIASFSGSDLWFHTAGDLPATLSPKILADDAEAFRSTVDLITALAPGQLRAENTLAAQHGTEIEAAKRAPTNPTLGSPGGTLGEHGVGGPAATPVVQCPS